MQHLARMSNCIRLRGKLPRKDRQEITVVQLIGCSFRQQVQLKNLYMKQ